MQRVNEYAFYELATFIHPLTELRPNESRYTDHWYELFQARSALDHIASIRPLHVCIGAARELYEAIDKVVPRKFDDAIALVSNLLTATETGDQPEEPISGYHIHQISSAAKKFETVLAAEIAILDTYIVSQKGAYRTPDLIERAEIVFPEAIRNHLPDKATNDIRQAGRCLALDTPTGAGFHLLRAVESVMSIYYNRVTGQNMPTRMRNWGIYLQKLRKAPGVDLKIIEFLDHIRDNYRNPVQHPDVFLTTDEAEVLFGIAASAIRQMILAIEQLPQAATVATTGTTPP